LIRYSYWIKHYGIFRKYGHKLYLCGRISHSIP
jgi:hypothetical protein